MKKVKVPGFLKLVAQILVIALTGYYIGREIARGLPVIKSYQWNLNFYFWGGCFLLAVPYLFAPFMWWWIMRRLGANFSLKEGYRIWALSNIAKYLPGKVWHILGRMVLYPGGKLVVMESIVLEMGAVMIAGFWVMLFTLFVTPLQIPVSRIVILILGALTLPFILKPLLLQKVIRYPLEKIKKEPFPSSPLPFSTLSFLTIFLISIFFWISYGIGYFLILKSIGLYSSPFLLSGVYAASWTLGYISLITPGGLGVREGVFVFLLKGFLPLGIPALLAILGRMVILLTESSMALFSLPLLRQKKTGSDLNI